MQLKEERVYFGSQFEGTVLHDKQVAEAEVWAGHIASPACAQLAFRFTDSLGPKGKGWCCPLQCIFYLS